MLLWDSPGQTAELTLQAPDLMPRRRALLRVQFRRRRAGQPPGGTVHDGGGHLQIAR